jgi:hypothetical protein
VNLRPSGEAEPPLLRKFVIETSDLVPPRQRDDALKVMWAASALPFTTSMN